jgi:phage repressor protein C with HTH and peptisase S24 domain
VIDGKVYALWYDGGERVKRLHRMPGGGLMIRSDNEAKYPPLKLSAEEAEQVRIIGRVVHVSGQGGL